MITAEELAQGLRQAYKEFPTVEEVAESMRKSMQQYQPCAQEFFAQKAVIRTNAQRKILKDMVDKL